VILIGLLAFAGGTATCVLANGVAFVDPTQDTITASVIEWLDWGPASYVLLAGIFVAALAGLVWAFIHFWFRGEAG
jgi:hypothetical protein